MIDLHTHTTASDGRCTPTELVARAAAAGVTVLSVTDHDTVAAAASAAACCAASNIEFVSGIEISSMRDGVDVHMLGYFIATDSPALAAFLSAQRLDRLDRLRKMIDKLRELGMELDATSLLGPAVDDPSKSAGRPWIARALVAAGYVASTNLAFEKWLSAGCPAHVPRIGATPETVIAHIHAAGGIASVAHPVLLGRDEWLPEMVDAGLDAIEAYHSKHDATTTAHYLDLARRLGVAVTGGSDYHADPSHGASLLGTVALPRQEFDALDARAALRRASLLRPS